MTAGRGLLIGRKKRTLSSRRWLERQLTDPYVADAKRQGFRARSAFKLIELDDRFRLLRPGARVVDLGAAPGGWTQVAVERVHADAPRGGGQVLAIDILDMAPLPGTTVLKMDMLQEDAASTVISALGGPANVVLSDMAPAASGHGRADHLRSMALAEVAWLFAFDVLAAHGAFVCKVWQGGTEASLLAQIKQAFSSVRHAKPPASRAESKEIFMVAQGFRGISHSS